MPNPGAQQGPPFAVANAQSPLAQCPVDPQTGAITVGGVANYTVLNTTGTTTLKSTPGVFYGLQSMSLGTSFAAVVYDLVPGTSTTVILGTATTTAVGQQLTPAPGIGIRTNGGIVVVTTGTAGAINAFWD